MAPSTPSIYPSFSVSPFHDRWVAKSGLLPPAHDTVSLAGSGCLMHHGRIVSQRLKPGKAGFFRPNAPAKPKNDTIMVACIIARVKPGLPFFAPVIIQTHGWVTNAKYYLNMFGVAIYNRATAGSNTVLIAREGLRLRFAASQTLHFRNCLSHPPRVYLFLFAKQKKIILLTHLLCIILLHRPWRSSHFCFEINNYAGIAARFSSLFC